MTLTDGYERVQVRYKGSDKERMINMRQAHIRK